MDVSSRYNDSTYSATTNLNEHRPTSATSSVRSQDSGVAQSDPKTSIDCSAKSESSPKVSVHNSNNYYLTSNNNNNNNSSSLTTRHRSPSSSNSNQHLLTTQQQNFDPNIDHIREKPQLFNTQRLKPYRQATKSLIVSFDI